MSEMYLEGMTRLARCRLRARALARTHCLAVSLGLLAQACTVRPSAAVRLAPLPAAPRIIDYVPDHGVAGDVIKIVGINLIGADVQFADAQGNLLRPLALGKLSWPEFDTLDMVQVTLPHGVATGPLSVRSAQGNERGKLFNVGKNLARAADAVISASSEYGGESSSCARAVDGDPTTSFFSALGNCASDPSCQGAPWLQLSFATPRRLTRVAVRGNREYAFGYDLIRVRFELWDEHGAPLWQGDFDLPEPDRDLDVLLPTPITGVRAVRVSALADESVDPGLSELELFDS